MNEDSPTALLVRGFPGGYSAHNLRTHLEEAANIRSVLIGQYQDDIAARVEILDVDNFAVATFCRNQGWTARPCQDGEISQVVDAFPLDASRYVVTEDDGTP